MHRRQAPHFALSLPKTVLQVLLQRKTCRTWAHFRAGLRSNPYPPHYRTAFASSDIPSPHLHRLALRLAFPCGRDTGFPRSASEVCGVRYLLSTGKRPDHEVAPLNPPTCLRAFWLELVSHFSSCSLTVVAQVHMCLPYPLPSHHPACGCQESRSLAVPAPHARACFCTLSGPLFIQAPRFTRWYGWFPLIRRWEQLQRSDIVSQQRTKDQRRPVCRPRRSSKRERLETIIA